MFRLVSSAALSFKFAGVKTPHSLIGSIPYVCAEFHTSQSTNGFDDFFDQDKGNKAVFAGRSWTLPDLRRKSFDDLHKLWFVLYKERNLLLTARQKAKRSVQMVAPVDESRYIKVKRSMGAIKAVLHERKKIDLLIKAEESKVNV